MSAGRRTVCPRWGPPDACRVRVGRVLGRSALSARRFGESPRNVAPGAFNLDCCLFTLVVRSQAPRQSRGMPRGPELAEGSQDAFPPRDVCTVGSGMCQVSPRPLSLVRQPAFALSQWQRYPRKCQRVASRVALVPEVELRPRRGAISSSVVLALPRTGRRSPPVLMHNLQ